MSDYLEAVKRAAIVGDAVEFMKLAATHGGAAIRMEDNPAELTTLQWAAA